MIWVVLNFISGFFINSYRKDAILIFSNTKIKINEKEIELCDIELLTVLIKDFEGKSHTGMYLGIGSFYPSEGAGNYFEIKTIFGEYYKLQFLIEYKKEITYIYRMMDYYEKKGLSVEFHKKDYL